MRFDEYRKHDATALAGLIARRDVSPEEVPEAAVARAEEINPAINAIVHKQYERARAAAGPRSSWRPRSRARRRRGESRRSSPRSERACRRP
jgi:Asp-tRNA(Asn)/Glu-tRNA(Gln) amidotransferase A subunit family amidase